MNQAYIAKLAGVSRATVGLVMSGKGRVSEETRRKVLEIAREHRYHPSHNPDACRLINRRHGKPQIFRKVGLVWPMGMGLMQEISYIHEILHGVMTGCERHSMSMLILNTSRFSGNLENVDLSEISTVDGLILPTFLWRQEEVFLSYCPRIVSVHPYTKTPGVSSVSHDEREIMDLAVEHLVSRGHRLIGFVGNETDSLSNIRLEALRRSMLDRGLTLQNSMICMDPQMPAEPNSFEFYRYKGFSAFNDLWLGSPHPTAVVVHNDAMALGVIEEARRQGVRVPEDLSVVGIDDIPQASRGPVPLTTVAVDIRGLGRIAVEIIEELVRQGSVGPVKRSTQVTLKERASVAPVPAVAVQ